MTEKTKINIETTIKDYMSKHFLFDFDEKNITFKTDLFKSGLIDSYGFVELITFIESRFHINISNEELASSSMNSFDGIIEMIDTKLKK